MITSEAVGDLILSVVIASMSSVVVGTMMPVVVGAVHGSQEVVIKLVNKGT